MRNAVHRPADRRPLVLQGVVVGIEESARPVERQAELVAMIMAVALPHDLKDGNRITAGPVTGRLIRSQHRQSVRRPDLRRSGGQRRRLGRKRPPVQQVWFVVWK